MLYLKLKTVLHPLKDERGQDLIEYALLGALIAVSCVQILGRVAADITFTLVKTIGNHL